MTPLVDLELDVAIFYSGLAPEILGTGQNSHPNQAQQIQMKSQTFSANLAPVKKTMQGHSCSFLWGSIDRAHPGMSFVDTFAKFYGSC